MVDKNTDFFKIEDHFKEAEHIPSIPIFENRLPNSPKFTIAIPTYKRAKYLKEALESAINQDTNEPYEIIVVDNNPERDDETERLMREYASVPNLSYYKNSENLGMVGNWNRLYTLSSTEWVIMLHDDDILFLDFLSFHESILRKFPDAKILYPSFHYSINQPTIKDYVKILKLNIQDFEVIGNPIGAPLGMMAKKQTVIALGGFCNKLYPALDMEFYVRAVYNKVATYKVFSSSKATYRWEDNESLKLETMLAFIENHKELDEALTVKAPILKKWFYRQCAIIEDIIRYRQWLNLSSNPYSIISIKYQEALQKSNLISKMCYYLHFKKRSISWYLRFKLLKKQSRQSVDVENIVPFQFH